MTARSAPFYGWKLLAALWAILFINLAFPMYGLSMLNPYMASDLHLDRTMLGLTYAVYMAMTGIPAPFAAWCVQRFGIRWTLIAGNLLLLVGAIAMATLVSSPLAIVLVAGAVVGTSDAVGGPVPAQAGVTAWFVRRRSLALAIVLSGGSVGGFVAAPLLDSVVRHFALGWRAGWWLVAVLALIACAIAWLAVKERPQDMGQRPDGASAEAPVALPADSQVQVPVDLSIDAPSMSPPLGASVRAPDSAASHTRASAHSAVHITTEDWSPGQALRSPTFWVVMAVALGFSAALTLFLAQGVSHLEDLHHSASSAALALSVSVICGLAANLGVGFLGDRIDPRWLWSACSALDAVGMLTLLSANSAAAMFSAAALLGIAGSGCMVCMVTLLANYYGPRAYAAVFGVTSAIQSTLGAVAPIVAGYWYDHHGSYGPIFLGIALWCIAAAIVLALLAPPTLQAASPAAGAPRARRRTFSAP